MAPYSRAPFSSPRKYVLEASKTIDKVALKVCLQRQVNNRADDSREQQFLSHVLEYLNSYSGYHVKIESWMITSYEVEFGHRIGVGGLYVTTSVSSDVSFIKRFVNGSGEVYKGIWNKTHVAIKVLVLQSGIIPSAVVRNPVRFYYLLALMEYAFFRPSAEQ